MGQTYHKMLVHIVFSTKNRVPTIVPEIENRLHGFIAGIVNKNYGTLICIGGVQDHIHMLVDMKPAVSASEMLRVIKSRSSVWIHETFPEYSDFLWQGGYGIFSVSQSSRKSVIEYIEAQKHRHRNVSFREELIEFLDAYGVDHYPRYVFK